MSASDGAAVRTLADPRSPIPLYRQLEGILADRIARAEWEPGAQLPSEGGLCTAYGVSRVTVRQALARLSDQGLIRRERGRGTFVKDLSLTAGARGVTSFTAEMAAIGVVAGASVLSSKVITDAGQDVLGILDLDEGANVLAVRRLRTGNGSPMGVQTSYLSSDRFPGLADIDLADASLYQILRERYGTSAIQTADTFTVGGVPHTDAEHLAVRPGAHAFFVERVSFDVHGPFEFVKSVMRGDRYRVRLVIRDN